jgi:hypothetical protein
LAVVRSRSSRNIFSRSGNSEWLPKRHAALQRNAAAAAATATAMPLPPKRTLSLRERRALDAVLLNAFSARRRRRRRHNICKL